MLTGHSVGPDSPFAPGTVLGDVVLSHDDTPPPGAVRVDSVLRFKGLERRAVILADLDAKVFPNLPAILRVGCSRARAWLGIALPRDTDPSLRARLEAACGPQEPSLA